MQTGLETGGDQRAAEVPGCWLLASDLGLKSLLLVSGPSGGPHRPAVDLGRLHTPPLPFPEWSQWGRKQGLLEKSALYLTVLPLPSCPSLAPGPGFILCFWVSVSSEGLWGPGEDERSEAQTKGIITALSPP